MANFFDDEADTHDHQVNPDNTRAGPSRRPARSRSPSEDDDDDDALPPPLAGRTTSYNNNDKGKARAPPAGYTSNAGAGAQRHARGSSSMSIDVDTTFTARHRHNINTTTTRQRDRGFLADDDDDDQDNERDDAERLGRDQDELQLDGDGGNNESDIQHLMRLYMDERMAPELLKFPEELITNLMQNLEAQTEAASVLLSSGITSKLEEHERLLLVQMEIERVRWLLRSYLRTRTHKIEKQAQYLLKTPFAKIKMSDIESGYAERYQSLMFKHFNNCVVGNIPERLGRLDEDEMIVRPDLDQAVFARARRDCPPILLPDQQTLEMKAGEIHLVRYKSVRRLVRDGDVRLV